MTGTQNPATITMDSIKSVRAVFTIGLELGVFVEGQGEIVNTQTNEPIPSGVSAQVPGTTITVQAVPAEGWTFVRWRGNDENTEAIRTVSLVDGPENLVAEFLNRTGVAELNLVQDLANMLTALGSTETVETFDRNHCAGLNEDDTWNYDSNGIPDAAEFSLLQTILKDFRLDHTGHSGVNSDLVWKAWEHNLAQAQTDLPGVTDMSILRTVAAYMTLGDFHSTHMVTDLIKGIVPTANLNSANYYTGSSVFLAHDADADNDGVSNQANWNGIVAQNTANAMSVYGIAAVGNSGVAPGGTTTPPPTQSSCVNGSCVPTGSAQVVPLVGWGDPPINLGTASASPSGAQLIGTNITTTVTANTSDGYGFMSWLAPGTMLNGSRVAGDTYRLMGVDTLIPMIGRCEAIIPPDTPGLTISVEPSEGAVLTTSADGIRHVYGSSSSTVTLTATYNQAGYSFVCFSNPYVTVIPRENWSESVTLPLCGEIRVITGPTASKPTDIVELSFGGGKGGTVRGSHTPPEYGGSFQGAVRIPRYRNVNVVTWPNPGYQFVRWSDGNTNSGRSVSATDSMNFSAVFEPIGEYELKIEDNAIKSEGGGGGEAPACAGFVTVENPDYPDSETPANRKKYYIAGEQIAVVAHPNPGYKFVHWEGDGTNVSGTLLKEITSEAVSIQMGPANGTCVETGRSRSVQAVFEKIPFELITPHGDPVTEPNAAGSGQNEFTYSSATPGILTIRLEAGPAPCSTEDAQSYTFSLTAIGNTQAVWASDNPGGRAKLEGGMLVAVATYTGLPQNNSDFGKKTASVSGPGGSASNDFEVFFPRKATNHPSSYPDDSYPTLVIGWPNFGYYWLQTGIPLDGPTPVTLKFGLFSEFSRCHPSEVSLGFDTCDQENMLYAGILSGIDLFAWCTVHEFNHRAFWYEHWESRAFTSPEDNIFHPGWKIWLEASGKNGDLDDYDVDSLPNLFEKNSGRWNWKKECTFEPPGWGDVTDEEDRNAIEHTTVRGNHDLDWADPGFQHMSRENYND